MCLDTKNILQELSLLCGEIHGKNSNTILTNLSICQLYIPLLEYMITEILNVSYFSLK